MVFFGLHASAQTNREAGKINTLLERIENSPGKAADMDLLLNQAPEVHGLTNKAILQIVSLTCNAQSTANAASAINRHSTSQFLKAIRLAEKEKLRHLQTWAEISYAFYLYTYRELKDAYPYFLKNIKLVELNDYEFVILPAVSYKRIGYFLSTINEFEKSNTYLHRAERVSAKGTALISALNDNIGMNYYHQKKFDSAYHHFNIAEKIALQTNDRLRYAKILGNRALVAIDQKKYQTAEKLLLKDIAITQQIPDEKNLMFAKTLLAGLYLKTKQYGPCGQYAAEALAIANSNPYFKNKKLEILDLQFQLAKISGNSEQELLLRRAMDRTAEDLKKMDGQENLNLMNWESRKEIFELKIEAEKAKSEKAVIEKTLAIILSVFLLFTVFFIRRHIRNKYKIEKAEYDKKILALKLQKVNSENKYNASQKTIDTFRTYLKEKNRQIEELENTVSGINSFSKAYYKEKTTVLQDLLQSHLMTAENWEVFKSNFIQEYPEFYETITGNFTDLTEANLRIIFLSKMDLKNNEIARILGVTLEAVKKSKQRLRKKYPDIFDNLF